MKQEENIRLPVSLNEKDRHPRDVRECRFLAGVISDRQIASFYLLAQGFPILTRSGRAQDIV